MGGRDFGKTQFDRVSLAKRQPGSVFKPFVFLTALDGSLNGYRTARTTSLLLDEPLSIEIPGKDPWEPQNYDKSFRGEVTVREALAKSLNVPTVRLASKVGIDYVARTAELFGFGDNLPQVPSLALGAGEVSPLAVAQAYAVLANGGLWQNVTAITSVSQGEPRAEIYRSNVLQSRVVSAPAVYVLTDILRSVIEEGTGRVVRRMGFLQPAAGKTGTSNDGRDTWFAGFTPRLLAVVWVGFDSSKALKLTGASAAAPIWTEFMKCAQPLEPDLDFLPPKGVVKRQIDTRSGLLATPHCPRESLTDEIFVEGTEPITACPLHSRRRRYEEDGFGYPKSESEKRRRRKGARPESLGEQVNKWLKGLFS